MVAGRDETGVTRSFPDTRDVREAGVVMVRTVDEVTQVQAERCCVRITQVIIHKLIQVIRTEIDVRVGHHIHAVGIVCHVDGIHTMALIVQHRLSKTRIGFVGTGSHHTDHIQIALTSAGCQ